MTENISILVVVEGAGAIKKLRALRGPTNLLEAPAGTIRHDFVTDEMRQAFRRGIYLGNLLHASGSHKEADFEIKLFFGGGR